MRGGGLRPEVWCDAGGDFALPITSSVHDLLIMLQRYAVFLYLQNLYLSTSKRCIKMGIPSLNIGIKIKFDFPFLSPLRWHRINIANISEILTIAWTWNAELLPPRYGQRKTLPLRLSLSRMTLTKNRSMDCQYEMKRTWSIEILLQTTETATKYHAMR